MMVFNPVVMCFGDMRHHKAFYIHSNLIYGGKTGIMKMGHNYYDMNMGFKGAYLLPGGKTPGWGVRLTEIFGDRFFLVYVTHQPFIRNFCKTWDKGSV